MIKEAWQQIIQNHEVRQNLSKIRQEIKEEKKWELFADTVEGEEEKLIALLDSEDAKTRKNAALLMGDLGWQEFLEPIFQAYQKEDQRFARSSYLAAMGKLYYEEYLPKLRDCMERLKEVEITAENEKHLTEEMRELSALIVGAEGITMHSFTGWQEPHDIVLLTNRNFPEYTARQLEELEPKAKTKLFNAGVRAKVESLDWIGKIRTYHELLFVIPGMESAAMEIPEVAEKIAKSCLLSWLGKRHHGKEPYYFRIEMKSKKPLDVRSAFVKKLSGQIERLTQRRLINDTANYEIELRIIENKEGNCNLLVKLFTLGDERFAYRQEVMPTSIRPVNAALTVELARQYLKEGAQVLDPFCGVGTMLIERYKAVKANTTYGVDVQEEAILKARRNTEEAGQIIHYINRDFFRFTHEYLFDEVITDMPFRIGRMTEEEISEVYHSFFAGIGKYLNENALLVLYSHNRELVEQLAPENQYRIVKKFEVSKKEGTYVFLLKTD